MRCPSLSLPLLVLVATWVASAAQADEGADDIDQRVRILERKLEIQEEAAAEKAKTAPSTTAGKEGFSWKSPDGAYVLKLRGYIHVDGRFFIDDEKVPLTSTLLIRRARPIIEATLAKSFDVRFMPDFGGGTATIQDAYVDWRASNAFRTRMGKFKPPFGLERLMSATEIVFVERAFPTSLAPNRDVGAQVGGDLRDGVASYALGIFNGVPDGGSGDTDINDSKEWVGRVMLTPFKKAMSTFLPGLSLGIAASVGENRGTATATGVGSIKSEGQATIFSYRAPSGTPTDTTTTIADGRHLRWSPQGMWYVDRFGAYGEYVESSQEIRLNRFRMDHEIRAWQVTALVLMTADQASPRGVTPKRPFDPSKGQWGAVELDGRYEKLSVVTDAFPVFADPNKSVHSGETWGIGTTWTLSRNVKLVVDYVETKYEGGAAAGGDRETEKVIFARTQYSF